ncbi:MAG TPA: 2-oxo acid dehydrogenase subunit E2 [Anaerohalosphaeraceae bacterium]|nr:2-oxo acid dehydrogenase subunit E2 [Anaerohalosphaeraceae bacterium]
MFLIKIPRKLRSPEAVINRWVAEEKKPVRKGQPLFFLKSADEIVEIQCPQDAFLLKILEPEGAWVAGGQAAAVIGEQGEDASSLNLLCDKEIEKKSEPVETVSEQKEIPSQPKEVKMAPQTASSIPAGKVVPVLMPQAGQTMEEGTLLAWKVKEGDRISVGQVIFEIETDKATMEVEAVEAGRLAKIVVREGQTVPVKTPVAYLAENDADVEAYLAGQSGGQPAAAEPKEAPAVETPAYENVQTAPAQAEGGRIKASPAARKAAAQRGIDLSAVSVGSGPGGRILSTDVAKAQPAAGGVQRKSMSKMRRAIANNLLYSKQNIPHFYTKLTIHAQPLFETYKQTKEKYPCSINDFVVLAAAKAIRQYPAFRSQLKDNEIVEFPDVNIGIAVGTDEGLTVPVLLKADQLPLRELAVRTRRLAENARQGKLEGVGQGIFTITNLGMFGVEEFSAIINPPESAILAVGAVREGVWVENGLMKPSRLMTMILSSDHRIIDGVLAAQFMQTLKNLLENPQALAQV